MSTFIDLDSIFRDRTDYPNPANYEVTAKQTEAWSKNVKTVKPFSQNPNTRPLSYVYNVSLFCLTIPYDESLVALPRLYVDFHSKSYNDINTMNSIEQKQYRSRFVCFPEKIQNDSQGVPTWIHYKSPMEQTLRFKLDDIVCFTILTRDTNVLDIFEETDFDIPIDPLKQTMATFQLIPYARDNDFTSIEPLSIT
jgi:hypothetical protein